MIYSQHKMTDYNVPPTADALPLADVLREHIREDRLARLTVTGNSMAPLLKSGDRIGLKYADKSRIGPGHVITFHDPGGLKGLTTHRIAARWQDDQGKLLLLTRGDHTLFFDRPCPAEAIVGQVVWRDRNGQKLHFDRGPGLWLSRQLGASAERERAQISGVALQDLDLTPDGITYANQLARLRREGYGSRLVSLASRRWREFLVFIVPMFAGQESLSAEKNSI